MMRTFSERGVFILIGVEIFVVHCLADFYGLCSKGAF
jgi:hypothetical protein